MQLLENLPHDDAGTHRHVDGVFGAFLRQLDGTIAIGQGFLADAFHLVSKDICGLRLELEILQSHAAFHLLYRVNPYTREPIYVARTPEQKKQQNQYFFWYKKSKT